MTLQGQNLQGQQTARGSALEWALASCLAGRLGVSVEEPRGHAAFDKEPDDQRRIMEAASEIAVTHILGKEKRWKKSIVRPSVKIPPTSWGEHGDPRDIVVSAGGSIYGISVKRNNNVLKNSRVQFGNPDFGESWALGMNVSPSYEKAIGDVAAYVAQGQAAGKLLWGDFGDDKKTAVYVPVVHAFMAEFDRMAKATPAICGKFVQYMLGSPDYYKVMVKTRGRPKVQVQGINLAGGLSCPKTHLPTELLSYRVRGDTTAILSFDGGWVFSLRIHNATKDIEQSLKWDVQMTGNPSKLYTHHEEV